MRFDFSFFTSKNRPELSIPDCDATSMTSFQIVDHIEHAISKGIVPGLRENQIEAAVDAFFGKYRLQGYFREYNGYPSSVTVSINHEVLGGPPSNRRLEEGEIVKIETGLKKDGQCAYLGWTFPVGRVSENRMRLLTTAQRALDEGCRAASLSRGTLNITKAIDGVIRSSGYKPNREFVGCRIGVKPHMPPRIPASLDQLVPERTFEEGTSLVLLVIAHAGDPTVTVSNDHFTIVSRDGTDSVLLSRIITLTKDDAIPRTLSLPEYR